VHYSATNKSSRVLIVDDCEVNRELLSTILSLKSFEFAIATNGLEALQKLENEDFGLVLMDVHMPVMDGFTATRQIRSKWPYRSLPIVAVTANNGDLNSELYREAGFSDSLRKPFSLQDINYLLTQYSHDSFTQRSKSG